MDISRVFAQVDIDPFVHVPLVVFGLPPLTLCFTHVMMYEAY